MFLDKCPAGTRHLWQLLTVLYEPRQFLVNIALDERRNIDDGFVDRLADEVIILRLGTRHRHQSLCHRNKGVSARGIALKLVKNHMGIAHATSILIIGQILHYLKFGDTRITVVNTLHGGK